MIVIKPTIIKNKWNLVDDAITNADEDKYIRQLSTDEVVWLGISILKHFKSD